MSKEIAFVTINSKELINMINRDTIMKLNGTETRLKQKLMLLTNKELKTISIKEYQKNIGKYILVDERRFVETINITIK